MEDLTEGGFRQCVSCIFERWTALKVSNNVLLHEN